MNKFIAECFAVVFFCLLANSANAQTSKVFGVIKDSNGEILVGATAVVEGTNNIASVADAKGFYSLEVPNGTHNITFSYLGFVSETKNVVCQGKNIQLNVALKEETVNIGEVVVTGKSSAQRSREMPSSVTVVDMHSVEGRTVSLTDVLNQSTGVKVMEQGGLGNASRICVQGLDGKRISIFMNGMPMGSSDNFQISSIPIDMIAKVEIYKGIIPAWLGGDGLGGAINIITHDYTTDHLEASYELSTYNTHRANLIARKDLGTSGISLNLNGSFDYSDNDYTFHSPFQEGLVIKCDNNAFRNTNINAGINMTKFWFDVLSISFGYNNIYDEVQGGLMTVQNRIHFTHTKKNAYSTTQNLSKKLFGGKLSFNLNSMIEYSTVNLVDTATVRYEWDGTITKRATPGELGSFPNNSNDKYWDVRELLNVKYQLNDVHSFNWNTSYKFSKKSPHDPLNDQYSAYSSNGYPSKLHALVSGITYNAKLFEGKLNSELSGKVFYQNSEVMPSDDRAAHEITATRNNSTKFGWSYALAWKPKNNLTLKASVAQAVRIPTAEELFGDCVLIYPSANLQPEKSFNANVGINWLVNSGHYPSLRVDLNAFYMNVDNMIKLFPSSAMVMTYENLSKAKIIGVEAEADADLKPWLSVKGNISYQNARDNTKEAIGGGANSHYDFRIPNIPYFFGNGEVELHCANLIGKNSYSAFFANMEYTHEFSYNWEYSKNNSLIIPEKWVFNAGIRQSFGNRYHVSLEVHNIADKEHWSEFRYALPGRTFHIKLKYTL